MIAVTKVPAKIPSRGLDPSITNMERKASESRRGSTEDDMLSIPINNTPKPITIEAISFRRAFLPLIIKMTPSITARGAMVAGLNIFAHSELDTSQPVTVVPMLAPMITLMACVRFIKPAFTKPTTITVVAEELCTMAVTNAPRAIPINLFCVSASKILFILEPAAF